MSIKISILSLLVILIKAFLILLETLSYSTVKVKLK